MLTLLLACGLGGGPQGSGTVATWSGTQHWQLVYNNGLTACDLSWTTAGEEASPCVGCTLAFDLTLTADEEASSHDGTCINRAGNQSLTLAWKPNNDPLEEGDQVEVGEVGPDGFLTRGTGSWDEATGSFSYTFSPAYPDTYMDYFELDEVTGQATISIPTMDSGDAAR